VEKGEQIKFGGIVLLGGNDGLGEGRGGILFWLRGITLKGSLGGVGSKLEKGQGKWSPGRTSHLCRTEDKLERTVAKSEPARKFSWRRRERGMDRLRQRVSGEGGSKSRYPKDSIKGRTRAVGIFAEMWHFEEVKKRSLSGLFQFKKGTGRQKGTGSPHVRTLLVRRLAA